jgi:CPA2 family monovalent cation:H+ antiporter-2
MRRVSSEWLQASLQMTRIARQAIDSSKHVIICGYGRCGQKVGYSVRDYTSFLLVLKIFFLI